MVMIMKKQFVVGFILGAVLFSCIGAGAASGVLFNFSKDTLVANSQPVNTQLYAYRGMNYAPVSVIADAFGLDRSYKDGKLEFTRKPTSLETVVKNCKDSCVMIYAYGDPSLPAGAYAQGSGWVYDGYVVTARHVIENATKIDVFTDDSLYGIPATAYPIKTDLDVAILKADIDLPSVTLGDSDKLIEGEKLVSITSPNGNMNSIDECLNSGITQYNTAKILTISESSMNIGSSGGATFTYRGEIIGLVTNGLDETHSAIPINSIKPILKQIK
jgi:S1-C subfamily serine protease